jgi:hypothetical protein
MSTVRKRLYHLWKKLSERQSRKKFEKDNNRHDIERFKSCPDKKPAARIWREMRALHRYWGCYPYQYYRFDFYRQDCALSVEEMKTYVPHFFMTNLFFPLSYKSYGVLCEDKLLTYALLQAYDVSQPKLLFCYDHNHCWNNTGSAISDSELNSLLQASTADKLFVKPRFGLGGKGIMVFTKNAQHHFTDERGTLLYDHFTKTGREEQEAFIVQEGLSQHQELSAIYPHSINTFRVITHCINGKARVLYALLRMGRGGKHVDNASSGGLYVKVDPDTGTLSNEATTYNRMMYTAHPDTGFSFKDVRIEAWGDVKAFAIEVATKLREINYLGWDIALTTTGPAVVEVNNSPDMGMIQDFYGGVRDGLQIKPKDWWYQSNYTIKNL